MVMAAGALTIFVFATESAFSILAQRMTELYEKAQ